MTGASAGIGAVCAGREVVVATGWVSVPAVAVTGDVVTGAEAEGAGLAGMVKPDLEAYFSSVGHQLGSTEFLSSTKRS